MHIITQNQPAHRVVPAQASSRRGVSLIELLVVISIMLIITAAAIPTFRPALESRKLREGARLVSSYFELAKNKARGSGRSVGVRIDPLDNEPGAAMVLSMVESPAPWAGDSVGSTVTFNASGIAFGGSTDEATAKRLLQNGDILKLNYRGYSYRIYNVRDPSGSPLPVINWSYIRSDNPPVNDSSGNPINPDPNKPPATGQPTPFQFFRQPVKSAVNPLQMPDGIVIDVLSCGMGNQWGLFGPLTLVFSPAGHVESVNAAGGTPFRPSAPVHFLVGKREKAATTLNSSGVRVPLFTYSASEPPGDQQRKFNWRDMENIWVSINSQTGLISSTNVAFFNDAVNEGNPNWSSMDADKAHQRSRKYAVDFQSMGGK